MRLGVALEGLRLVFLLTVVERLQVGVFVLALLLEEGAELIFTDADLVVAGEHARNGALVVLLVLLEALDDVLGVVRLGHGGGTTHASVRDASATATRCAATATERGRRPSGACAAAGAGDRCARARSYGAGRSAGGVSCTWRRRTRLEFVSGSLNSVFIFSLSRAHPLLEVDQAVAQSVLSFGGVIDHGRDVRELVGAHGGVLHEHQAECVRDDLSQGLGGGVIARVEGVGAVVHLARVAHQPIQVDCEIVVRHWYQRPSEFSTGSTVAAYASIAPPSSLKS